MSEMQTKREKRKTLRHMLLTFSDAEYTEKELEKIADAGTVLADLPALREVLAGISDAEYTDEELRQILAYLGGKSQ